MRLPKSVQADLALVLVTVIWGSTFTIVKNALAQVSPMLFIALRFWIASLVCIPLMAGAVRKISPQTLRRGAILAFLLLGGFIFQTLGLQGSTPSKSAFITALSVLLVPIFGFLLFKHRPRIQTGIGILLATVGLGLLTLDRLELSFSYGDTLTLICAVFFALHILFVGRYSPLSDYRQLVVLQVMICAGAGSVATPIFDHPPFLVWDVRGSFYLIVTGVLATALGFYVQNSAQRFTTPNRTALIFSLEPVFAALFAYLILGHTPTAKEWAGGALILSGILLSQLRRD